MRNLKLLTAICTFLIGGLNLAHAQTDVTAQYIKNADFEGDYSSICTINTDHRYVYQPQGWTVDYVNVSKWNMTVVSSTDAMAADNFTGDYAVPADNRKYMVRFRDNHKTEYIDLSQTITIKETGVYTFSADLIRENGSKISVELYAGENSVTNANPGTWENRSFSVLLTKDQEIKVGIKFSNLGADGVKAGADNIKITYTDPLEAARNELSDLITDAQALNVATEEQEALNAAITAAQNTLNSGTTEAELYAAIKALRTAMIKAEKGLSNASYMNPSADLLVNGSFDTANSGWTLTNMGYQQNKERPTRYVEKWQGSALTGSGSAKQTLSNLPAGAYILKGTINTNKEENGGAVMKINTQPVNVSGSWKEYVIEYNLESDGDITVSFEYNNLNSNWIAIDDFSLVYSGEWNTYLSDKEALQHKKAWDEAKAAAEAAIANADYANVTGQEKSDLQTEIDKAEPTTASGYDAAAEALTSATATFVNAKASYDALVNINALITAAGTLTYADATKKPSTDEANNAEDAASKAITLTTALRAYYESHALAEGVADAVNKTEKIANPNAEDGNNGWTWEGSKNDPASNQPWTDADGNNTHKYFDGGNWGGSNWKTTMQQTITLPAGKYLLTAKGRAASNTTLTMAVGENSVELPHVGSTGNVFNNGWGDASVEFETEGSATIIVTAEAKPQYEWFSISDFRLVLLEANLDVLKQQLTTTVNNAKEYEDKVPAAVYEAINNVITANNKEWTTVDEYTAAIEAINTAVTDNATAGIMDAYAAYKQSLANVEAIKAVEVTDASPKDASLSTLNTTLSTIDEAVQAATTVDVINEETAKVNPTILVYIKDLTPADAENAPFDLTFMITNPSFDNEYAGWSYSTAPNPGNDATQKAAHAMEYFQKNFDIYQELSGMPTGLYRLKVKAYQRPGSSANVVSAYVNAENKANGTANVNASIYVDGGNEASQLIKNAASPMLTEKVGSGNESEVTVDETTYYIPNDMVSAVAYFGLGYYENEAEIVATTNKVKFGFRCTEGTGTSYWTIFDDFRLYYAGQLDLSVFEAQLAEAVETAEGLLPNQMSVTASLALDDALQTYNKTWTNSDEYTTAIDAINAAIIVARNSIAAYASAKEAIDLANDVLDNTNVYTTEAYKEFYTDNFAVFTQKYNNGELTDEEAAAYYGQTFGTGVRTANTIDDLLLSAWGVKDYEGNPYVNTWSTEGNNDGSNFKTPFFEDWVNSGSLVAKTMTATVPGLGADTYYDVSGLVRVSGNDKIAGSITMQVGDGEAVDVTAGEQIAETDRYLKSYTATGKTDVEGNLIINISVAANSNIGWLAFKNLKYTEILVNDAKDRWMAAKDAASTTYNNEEYANVAGKEKSTLLEAINVVPEETVESYMANIDAINDAVAKFIAAKEAYDNYAEAKTAAEGINEANVLAVVIENNDNVTAEDAQKASVILTRAFGTKEASAENGVSTDYVVNGMFDSNVDGWTCTGNFQNRGLKNATSGTLNKFWENWTPEEDVAANKMYQTVENIPNGTYKLSISAFVNKLDVEKQYVFANDDKTPLTEAANPGADYEVWTVVTNNTAEVGLEQIEAIANWMGIDNVVLSYYGPGDVIDAAKFGSHKTDWQTAKAAAETAIANDDYAIVTGKERSDLQAEIEKAEPTSIEGYDSAAIELNAATQAFTAAKEAYEIFAEYNNVLKYADEAKKPGEITSETTATSLLTALRAYYESHALAESEGDAVNKTEKIANPNAEDGNNGWTWEGSKNNPASDEPWTDADGNNNHKYFDGGNWNANSWTTTMKQTITLPAGTYLLTAKGRAASNTTLTMAVGENSVELPHVSSVGNVFGNGWGDASVEFETTGDNFEISVTATSSTIHEWFSISDFRLMQLSVNRDKYVSDYATALANANAKKEEKMSNDAMQALSDAIDNNTLDQQTASVEDLQAAIAALNDAAAATKPSIDAYAAANAALTKANEILNSTNVYTAEARSAFEEAINDAQAAYENGDMTDATANDLNKTLNVAGYGTTPAPLSTPYIYSAWTDTNNVTEGNFWSWEGDGDEASGMSTPFIQYWVAKGQKLADNTITAALTEMENGLYSVTAFVRVFNNKTEEGDTGYEGISLQVNDGDAVAFADATEYTDGYAKEITAEGLVKDGNLSIKFAVEGTNASWLAFKNVNYTKVRDLTPEEAAIIPTAIALADVELNASENSKKLTPTFTPEDATNTVTWTSSDENVATVSADGVVTGVAPGTATITVTSTLNTNISASATVTVTYPETAVPEKVFANENAKRTIYTLSQTNIVKNGSFEYPDAYYDWTVGTGNKMTNAQFSVETEEGDHYIQSVLHNGSNAAGSLRKAWPIEPGKKYVFGYKLKNVSGNQVNNNSWFRVSLCNANPTDGDGTIIETYPSYNGNWTENFVVVDNTATEFTYVQAHFRWLGENGEHTCFNDFYLCEVTDTKVEGNVDYATAAIPTVNIGEGAFQYSQNAIDAANALVQGTATVEDVETAYEAVTTLNAPENGKLYNVVNVTANFAHKDKALTFMSAKNADLTKNTTSMGWLEAPGSIYPQGVKFTAVEGVKNGYTMSYTRADGNEIFVSTGSKSGLGSNTQQIRPTTDATKALTIVINVAGDNTWKLYNSENKNNIGSDGNTGFYTSNGSNSDVKIQEAVDNEVALNIKVENQYGTFILPFDAELPSGVVAYSVSETQGSELVLETVNSFKANTPYIVYAENGLTETKLAGLGSAYTDATFTEGLLNGVYVPTLAPVGSYVMQKLNGKVGFFKVVEGEENAITVPANRAYLEVPSSSRPTYILFDNVTTGVSAIEALTSGEALIFDANGVQQPRLVKGLNIIRTKDGKTRKVMVK